jgi:hypothetical protein
MLLLGESKLLNMFKKLKTAPDPSKESQDFCDFHSYLALFL